MGARAAAVLEPPADALVQALKYGGWRTAAGPMVRRMAARLRGGGGVGSAAALVPVPTTPARERRRGYNQARLLAAGLAGELGIGVIEALARRPTGASQVALQVDQRRANVSRAFVPGPDARRPEVRSHLILVDDVLTTGATVGAAAEALAALGAAGVTAVAFARALPRPVVLPASMSSFTP